VFFSASRIVLRFSLLFAAFWSVCVDFVDLLLKDVLQIFEIAIVIVDQYVQSLQLAVF
jgi:hypothetical protein